MYLVYLEIKNKSLLWIKLFLALPIVQHTFDKYCLCFHNITGDDDQMELDEGVMTDDNTILQHGEQFARHLADGLADNWSQVRINPPANPTTGEALKLAMCIQKMSGACFFSVPI